MKASTIFMTACKATQTAAEAFFPMSFNKITPARSNNLKPPQIQKATDQKAFLQAATGYALLVGINNYNDLSNLKGCINDANDVRAKLLSFGWKPDRTMVLLDEQATKSGIISGIKWLVSHCDNNDSLYFHFSGHGSWTLTNNGQGWECCICCNDCNQDDWDNGIITRTEFISALERPSGNLHVSLDTCFSGGMTPYYPAQKKLPSKVYEILYRAIPEGRYSPTLRAFPGPEWLTISSTRRKLHLSRRQLKERIENGSLQSRNVINGPLYIHV